jgi:hypothetical protein
MLLKLHDKLAINWDLVYAIQTVKLDEELRIPSEIWVFCDSPKIAPGEPVAKITDSDYGLAIIGRAQKEDSRFKKIDLFFYETSKVAAVALSEDKAHGTITFHLSNNQVVGLALPGKTANRILLDTSFA